jgi:hypothetical protein
MIKESQWLTAAVRRTAVFFLASQWLNRHFGVPGVSGGDSSRIMDGGGVVEGRNVAFLRQRLAFFVPKESVSG